MRFNLINFYFRLFLFSFFNLFLIDSFSFKKESSFKKLFSNKNSRNALFSYFTMVISLKLLGDSLQNYLLNNKTIENIRVIKINGFLNEFGLEVSENLNFFGFSIKSRGFIEELEDNFNKFFLSSFANNYDLEEINKKLKDLKIKNNSDICYLLDQVKIKLSEFFSAAA